MYTTVPLVISPTYYGDAGTYSTYYPPAHPTTVTPLGSAVFNDGLVVTTSSSPGIIEQTIVSPSSNNVSLTSSYLVSPYSYTRSPSGEYMEYRDRLVDAVVPIPAIVPQTTTYVDVNADPSLQKNMSKFFYEKLMNKWLPDSFSDLLDLVAVTGNKTKLVSKVKDTNKTTDGNRNAKIGYISEHVMSKYHIRSFLKKFVTKSGINWYDLKHNIKLVKKSLYKRIRKTLIKEIEG